MTLTVEQIVEIAEQYEYKDADTGNVCFDRLGFAQAVIAAAAPRADDAQHPAEALVAPRNGIPAMLETWAGFYERMDKIGDGRVRGTMVATDIRRNIIPAILATDYAAMEKEHLGDPEKRTGIYESGNYTPR